MTAPAIHIGERVVGPGQPVYVIAEVSANHHQQLDRAPAPAPVSYTHLTLPTTHPV